MYMNKTARIYDEIENSLCYDSDVVIKIKEDKNTFEKTYDFQVAEGELGDEDYIIETVARTNNINIFNSVLFKLLRNGHLISFDWERI